MYLFALANKQFLRNSLFLQHPHSFCSLWNDTPFIHGTYSQQNQSKYQSGCTKHSSIQFPFACEYSHSYKMRMIMIRNKKNTHTHKIHTAKSIYKRRPKNKVFLIDFSIIQTRKSLAFWKYGRFLSIWTAITLFGAQHDMNKSKKKRTV